MQGDEARAAGQAAAAAALEDGKDAMQARRDRDWRSSRWSMAGNT